MIMTLFTNSLEDERLDEVMNYWFKTDDCLAAEDEDKWEDEPAEAKTIIQNLLGKMFGKEA